MNEANDHDERHGDGRSEAWTPEDECPVARGDAAPDDPAARDTDGQYADEFDDSRDSEPQYADEFEWPDAPEPGETQRLGEIVAGLVAELAETRARVESLERQAEGQQDVLDIQGAARLLECSRRTVERLVQAKQIPHVRIHGQRGVRFVRTDLLAWLRKGCPRQGTPRLHAKRHAPGLSAGQKESA